MNGNVIHRGLGITRAAMGLVALTRPRLIARTLGMDYSARAASDALARMFGIRDIALATLTLGTDAQVHRAGLRLGVLADGADAFFIAQAARNPLPVNVAGAAWFAALCAVGGLMAQYRGE
jgi:hypothetical protein